MDSQTFTSLALWAVVLSVVLAGIVEALKRGLKLSDTGWRDMFMSMLPIVLGAVIGPWYFAEDVTAVQAGVFGAASGALSSTIYTAIKPVLRKRIASQAE